MALSGDAQAECVSIHVCIKMCTQRSESGIGGMEDGARTRTSLGVVGLDVADGVVCSVSALHWYW